LKSRFALIFLLVDGSRAGSVEILRIRIRALQTQKLTDPDPEHC